MNGSPVLICPLEPSGRQRLTHALRELGYESMEEPAWVFDPVPPVAVIFDPARAPSAHLARRLSAEDPGMRLVAVSAYPAVMLDFRPVPCLMMTAPIMPAGLAERLGDILGPPEEPLRRSPGRRGGEVAEQRAERIAPQRRRRRG